MSQARLAFDGIGQPARPGVDLPSRRRSRQPSAAARRHGRHQQQEVVSTASVQVGRLAGAPRRTAVPQFQSAPKIPARRQANPAPPRCRQDQRLVIAGDPQDQPGWRTRPPRRLAAVGSARWCWLRRWWPGATRGAGTMRKQPRCRVSPNLSSWRACEQVNNRRSESAPIESVGSATVASIPRYILVPPTDQHALKNSRLKVGSPWGDAQVGCQRLRKKRAYIGEDERSSMPPMYWSTAATATVAGRRASRWWVGGAGLPRRVDERPWCRSARAATRRSVRC